MTVSSTCLCARILLITTITTIPIRGGRYFRAVDASSLATVPNKFARGLNSGDNETKGDSDGAFYGPGVPLCWDNYGNLVAPDGTNLSDGAYAYSHADDDDGGTSNQVWGKCVDIINFGNSSTPSYPEQGDDSVPNISLPISPTATEVPGMAPSSRPTSYNTTRIPTTRRPTSRNTTRIPTTRRPTSRITTRIPTKRPTKAPTLAAAVVAPSGNNSSSEVTKDTTLVPTKEPDSSPPVNLDFGENRTRHLIACHVSCALPPLHRHSHDSDEESQDESQVKPDSSEDEDQVPRNRAYRLMFHVKQIMAHVIHERTNFTVVMNDKEGEGDDFDGPDTDVTFDYRGDDVVLVESIPECNTTETERLVGEHDGVVWWMYTVSYYTNETNFTYIQDLVLEAVVDAVKSGEFFEDLLEIFHGLVAVSLPGEEMYANLKSDSSSSSDESEEPVGVEVESWDPSRWIGLGLFLFTLLASMTFTRTAIHRRKKLQEYEEWGIGLATETDMNQFLTLGCEFDGLQVRTFDKSRLVYRDDDSMLIGGVLPMHCEIGDIGASTAPPTSSPTEGSPSSGLGTQPSDGRGGSSSVSL